MLSRELIYLLTFLSTKLLNNVVCKIPSLPSQSQTLDDDEDISLGDLVEDQPDSKEARIIYLATASQSFTPGKEYPVSVTIHRASSPVNVQVAIYQTLFFGDGKEKNLTIASRNVDIQQGTTQRIVLQEIPDNRIPEIGIPWSGAETCDQVEVSNDTDLLGGSFRLLITGKDNLGNNFTQSQYITSYPTNQENLVFIQTDKPLYKVGDTVRFRVISVGRDLIPLNVPAEVKIYDPQRNLIKQYLRSNVTVKGLLSGEVEIASQGLQGSWTIEVKFGDSITTKGFTVAEYVLPRFDVQLKAPTLVAFSKKSFTASISANYTFGEPVRGTAYVAVRGPSRYGPNPFCKPMPMPMPMPMPFASQSSMNTGPSASEFGRSMAFGGGYRPQSEFADCQPIDLSVWKNFTIENFNGTAKVLVKLSEVLGTDASDWQSITVQGSISEATTGLNKSTGEKYVSIRQKMYRLEFSTSNRVFQPELPVRVYIKAVLEDGRPIPPTSKKMKVNMNVYGNPFEPAISGFNVEGEKQFTVPDDGVVVLDFTPPKGAKTVNLNAQLGQVSGSYSLQGYSSPTNSFLKIKPLVDNVINGQDAVFAIELTNPNDVASLNYMVFSKGRTILENIVPVGNPKTTLRISVNSDIAPRGRLLVYYIRPDGEVVANGMDFVVSGFMRNPVNLSIATPMGAAYAKPGDKALVRVSTSPYSTVGMLGMDQSLLLLETGNDFTTEEVERAVDSSDPRRWAFSNPYGNSTNYWTASSDSVWSTFQDAGLIVLSNAVISGSPSTLQSYGYGSYGGAPMMSMMPVAGAMAMSDVARPQVIQASSMSGSGPVSVSESKPKVRKDFRETFLFETVSSGSSGIVDIERKIPDTITSWVCTAFSLNNELGLGITQNATTLTVFQPFFVVLNLPYSVVRGETLQTEILIFNYLNQDQNVKVTLDVQGEDWRGNSFRPPAQSTTVFVASNNLTKVVFPVSPTVVGEVEFKVVAQSASAGDAVQKSLTVKAEGVQQHFTAPVFVDLRNKSTFSVKVPIPLPQSGKVQGSERMVVSAIGDFLGPTINGIENLIRIPYGCGEQNMVTLAPNVYVLQYLQSGDRLDIPTRNRLLRNINSGFQRQLNFRHIDGSFSAFGPRQSASGSTFLTAFVLKTFAQAGKYSLIERNILEDAANWLINHQAQNGSFPEVGKLFDKELQGGVTGPVSLTAYVLISLIEAQPSVKTDMRGSMQRAYDYLEAQLRRPLDVYQLAIVTYALQLSGGANTLQNEAERRFQSAAVVVNGTKHWQKARETVTNDIGKYSWEYQLPAKDIEMTAYGLLKYAKKKDIQGGYPVLAWLLSKRNEQGGFQSSQDTVVGLQAIAAFAELAQDDKKSMQISVSGRSFSTTFNVTTDNSLVLQSFEPSTVDDLIVVNASGEGTALVQIAWLYNVQVVPEQPAFELKVNTKSSAGALKVIVCTRYLGEGESNMAIVEVNLPSGYQFDEEQTNGLIKDPSTAISRVDVENESTTLQLYVDEISADQQCVSLSAFRAYKVDGQLSVTVAVYDYYKPMNRKTSTYLIDQTQSRANAN